MVSLHLLKSFNSKKMRDVESQFEERMYLDGEKEQTGFDFDWLSLNPVVCFEQVG